MTADYCGYYETSNNTHYNKMFGSSLSIVAKEHSKIKASENVSFKGIL
jgi:hypothetical protein